MRVLEPNNIKPRVKPRKKQPHHYFLIIVLFIIVGIVLIFFGSKNIKAPSDSSLQNPRRTVQPQKNITSDIKTFTADEFRDLYNSFAYPNTELINEETPITGNLKADARIRQLAESRGYKLRSAPVSNAFIEVSDSKLLQQRAARDWLKLEKTAKEDGANISISEAFRSADDQKSIFLSRLGNISLDSIANGSADNEVVQVLAKTAPPGYSRHHSGYTIDLVCDNHPGLLFENSVCFEWLSKDNYINAKKAGWIPSYPEGTKLQGPEPESWEYVWVGVGSLYE